MYSEKKTKKDKGQNESTFTLKFHLEEREKKPKNEILNCGNDMSCHHIMGRKYIQLLWALAIETGLVRETNQGYPVEDDAYVIKRFAGWPLDSKKKPQFMPNDSELKKRFFWSPFNLFIGPNQDWRGFDPSSGVEQICPASFPTNTWEALKAIPIWLEQIGVDLKQLVSAEDNSTIVLKINQSRDRVKQSLKKLLKQVCRTSAKGTAHGFRHEDWVAVKYNQSISRKIKSSEDVTVLYEFCCANQLVIQKEGVTNYWEYATINNRLTGIKFILKPKKK